MKTSITSLALLTPITSSAFAALKAPLPEFENEKQLAEWRAEKASQLNTRTATEESSFYTGRPYLASSGSYAFKYRAYNPEIARWTSEDFSGFPDGANNKLYVNNMSINCIDIMVLKIWQITNSNSVGGGGHTAMISGSGTDFQLQSFGSGLPGSASSGANGLSTQRFDSTQAALDAAISQGYDKYNSWNTSPEQDSAARNAFRNEANNANYNVASHNCADAVTAGLLGADVDHDPSSNNPNQSHTLNSLRACSTGPLTRPE